MRFCSLYSGSSGNCLYVEGSYGKILVDAGLSGIKISSALKEIDVSIQEVNGILITHDHSDHIKGAGILSRKYNIPLYLNEGTWNIIKDQVGKVKDENVKIFDSSKSFDIEDLHIKPFPINHDASEPVGFAVYCEKNKVSIVTDTGTVDEVIYSHVMESDLLVMESNHDVNMLMAGRYPYFLKKRIQGDLGHLSNECAAEIIVSLAEQGLNRVVLAHLSDENNFPQLALETTMNQLRANKMEDEISVEVASRYTRSNIYNL
ncbi:MAG: MBL fold metallo-hydrolase [Eubacteriaceae bacterium]|nr:MBL fold metallo-hydrolase [Eubacteriaceae bacterium]